VVDVRQGRQPEHGTPAGDGQGRSTDGEEREADRREREQGDAPVTASVHGSVSDPDAPEAFGRLSEP
jgi:hypothetical protein